jgi:hypothetical protein
MFRVEVADNQPSLKWKENHMNSFISNIKVNTFR